MLCQPVQLPLERNVRDADPCAPHGQHRGHEASQHRWLSPRPVSPRVCRGLTPRSGEFLDGEWPQNLHASDGLRFY